MKKILTLLALGVAAVSCGTTEPDITIIPSPLTITLKSSAFSVPEAITVSVSDPSLQDCEEYLHHVTGAAIEMTEEPGGQVKITLDSAMDSEAYALEISAKGIDVRAGSYKGVINALATVGQIRTQSKSGTIRGANVQDSPLYEWRGYQLDVSRHFFTIEEVKSLLLEMADYKMNQFHWHLADDEGWRVEIKKYPQLTQTGAWRDPATHRNDIACAHRGAAAIDSSFDLPKDRVREDGMYGGFYTQDEIRGVVQFAASLGIDIIPELDMPGHSLALLQCFPQLTCHNNAAWCETFSTPLCLGNDEVLDYCKDIYREIFELFPYKYVHLGADEVEQSVWKSCTKCQRRIRAEGLGNESGLQAWFVKQMEAFFIENGKTLIVWDDAVSPELDPSTVIQWWRSWRPDTLKEALELGHTVLLSPGEYMYLDGSQNRNTFAKVYGYDPIDQITEPYKDQIAGVHCNLWCEYVPSFDRACYQIFPRFFIASQLFWAGGQKDAALFEKDVIRHIELLDARGWNFRSPDLGGFCDDNVFIDKATVTLTEPQKGITVRYTSDGSVPTAESALYEGPITVSEDCTLNFRRFTASGKAGDTQTARYRRAEYFEPTEAPESLGEGLVYKWYTGMVNNCTEIGPAAEPRLSGTVSDICIPEEVRGRIALILSGYIDIPEDGIYSFFTYSDDGSLLIIDGVTVVDNDGPHSREEKSGQAALRRGLHSIEVRYFDFNGGILQGGFISPEGTRYSIPEGWLKH